MGKRGISSLPFIYVLGLLTAVLIAIFGFRTVSEMKEQSELVSLSKFVIDLEEEIERYSNFDVGSEKRIKIALPEKAEEVCFANNDADVNQDIDDELKLLMEADDKSNMYILPLRAFPAPAPDFEIKGLDIDPGENPLCIKTDGFLNAVIETKVKNNKIYVELRR